MKSGTAPLLLAAWTAASLAAPRLADAAASIELRPSTTTLTLGVPASVEMTARYPRTLELAVSTTVLDAFAVIGWSPAESRTEGEEKVERRVMTLLPLDVGEQTLPALEVELKPGGRSLKSPPVKFDVLEPASVRKGDKTLRDLKPYWLKSGLLGRRGRRWLLALLLLAAALAAAAYWRRRKEEGPAEPPLPPHLRALRDLEDLERTALARGAVREFYERLSAILREYLHGRFGLPALYLTTRDIARLMRESEFDRARQAELRSVLDRADLVKFAKELPLAGAPAGDLARIRAFVLETAPRPEPAPEAAA
jgi:hypothetical protein